MKSKALHILTYIVLIVAFGASLVFPVSLTIVDTSSTQTLTNKTLTAPTITSPTISGTTTIGSGATLTSPAISSPTLSGTAIGTYTLGGTPTISSPTISGTVAGSASYTSPTLTSPTISGTLTGNVVTSANIVNGEIVNADISSSAAITMDKLAAVSSCAAGYTEIRGWCMDTDGTLSTLRTVSASEGSYTTTAVNANAKLAIIKAVATTTRAALDILSTVHACVLPGDSSVTACTNAEEGAAARVVLADDATGDANTVQVRTDSSGQVKTRCLVTGSVASTVCTWYIAGYMP